MQGLKKRLNEKKGNWVEELNNIIWAYRTTPKTSTREMPLRITYGMDVVIPVEIGSLSYRVTEDIDQEVNNINALICLYMLKERREQAAIIAKA